ncbi:galactose-binding domain-like protein [Catenaria anguillulae PL171]|uniref:Galactose-binding domain-like protein n=1 Tax=Catenaria anguillulae PL171 TaxID=765915 RepID=A0A1Y2HGS5_9FUNG|nr:galactose-binding domain-like protein [Catenaria anguillulae PL171]
MNSQHWTGFIFSGLTPQSPLNDNSLLVDNENVDDDHSDMDQDLPLIDVSRAGLWTISSGRTDPNDEECFLDTDNLETFWTTGLHPGAMPLHWIMVRFPKIVHVSKLELYLDHARDLTWCPRLISCIVPCDEDRFTFSKLPVGWQSFNLTEGNKGAPLPCSVVKIMFEQNFSNGQNMRLRGLKLFATPSELVTPVRRPGLTPINAPPATPRSEAEHNPTQSPPAPTSAAAPQWQLSFLSHARRPDPLR